MSTRTLGRAIQCKQMMGSVAKAQAVGRGRPRSLLRQDCDYLLRLARYNPTLFLDEYSLRLEWFCALSVSLTTIHQSLERAGLNVKHVQKLAKERDPFLRAIFRHHIGQYPAHYLISIDEVSKDDHTYTQLWGRAPIGERVAQHGPFVWKRRYSMLAGMVLDEGIIASRVLEGSFTNDTFLEYLRNDLVHRFLSNTLQYLNLTQLPLTTPFPGPRSVLLLDNAQIHHSEEVTDLVHSYGKDVQYKTSVILYAILGCRLEYLPPYSPDYQPVEQAFSVIKSHLCHCGLSFYSAHENYYELYHSCEEITLEST